MRRRGLTILLMATALLLAGAAPAHAGADTAGPVIVIGAPGLTAADLSPTATPALWRLLDTGASAALSVRTGPTVTCPAAGWLTLGAGARSAADCFPDLVPDEHGHLHVAGFAAIAKANRHSGGSFGVLATSAARAGCATAIGPGAALALIDADGRVAADVRDTVTADSLGQCPLTIVDAGSDRPSTVDATVAAVVAAAPAGATVIVAGLADRGTTAELHVVLAAGPHLAAGRLDTPSTRQPGLVQLTDLTPTIVDALGVAPSGPMVGSAVHSSPTPMKVADLRGRSVAADVQRDLLVPFFATYAVALLALVGLALLGRPVRRLASGLAAVPVATYLVNVVPWWDASHPRLVLLGLLAGTAAALTPLGPRVLAPLTALVLVADAATGSRLQMCSLYGQSPLIAGRFYGFGNSTFAVFAVASLVSAFLVTQHLQRRQGAVAVALIGAAAVGVEGWPELGADVGGVLALAPAFALLALWTAGVRVTAGRLALVGGGALAVLAAIATLDWRRPPEARSHLGAFVQQIVDGRATDVLWRKASTNLHSFTDNPLALLVPVALVVILVLVRRGTFGERWPMVAATLVAATIGLLVNDSGATVPAMAMTLAVPLTIALRTRTNVAA
jgi:hypothetical protein